MAYDTGKWNVKGSFEAKSTGRYKTTWKGRLSEICREQGAARESR